MRRTQLRLIKRIRRFVISIWEQEGTPFPRSLGIGLGVFSGCFPLFGLQAILAVVLASICKANRLLAVIGTWISNPFTYIPLYWFNHKVGSLFLRLISVFVYFTVFNLGTYYPQGWFSFSFRLFLGSTIVGFLLGLLAGIIIYLLLRNISLK